MKKYISLLVFFVCSLSVSAQWDGGFGGNRPPRQDNARNEAPDDKTEYHITGRVLDEKGEPMVAVSVRLLSAADSSLVAGTGTMTDDGGKFLLNNLKRGNYLVHLTFLGYKPQYKEARLLRVQPSAELGTVTLEPDVVMLQEAVVVGVVPPVVVKEDTLEYNADSFKAQPNAAVEDVLKKLPGVDVDDEGGIKVQGKEVKKILVDGKEFFSDDPKVASKNLPASMIDKIQVVDRKSDEARFSGVDDGEEETVINLTVKKGMKQGWFGAAQGGGGTRMEEFDPMYEVNGIANRFVNSSQFTLLGGYNNTNNQGASDLASSMFQGSNRIRSGGRGEGKTGMVGGNFNTGNESETFRVGGSVNYMTSNRYYWSRSEQQNFLTADSSSFVNSLSENKNISHNLRMNFRLRWEIDTLTTLEFAPNFGFNKSLPDNESFSETMGGYRDVVLAERDSVNDQRSISEADAHGYNLSGRLSFSRAFRSDPRRRLSFSFNYSGNRNEEDGTSYDLLNLYRQNVRDSIRNQQDNNTQNGKSYDVRATYVEPLSTHYYLDFVYQYRYNNNDADAYTYDMDDAGGYVELDSLGFPVADPNFSDVSRSRYQTHRGEVSLRGVYAKMNFSVGGNVEHQKRETRYLFGRNTDNDITTRTFNFSPSLRLRYRINKNKNLRADYRGNSTQPSARQLQQAPDMSNPLNIYIGNPDLKSSFRHRITLRYNAYNPDTYRTFSLNANANVTQNSIVDKTTYTDDGGRIRTPINVNGEWSAGAWIYYDMPFKRNKKFRFNSNTNLNYQNSVGFVSLDRKESDKNISRDVSVGERVSLRYSAEHLNFFVEGNYNFEYVNNTIQTSNNLFTSRFGARAGLDCFFDCGLSFGTDCRYTGTAGMAEGYNLHKVMWNASVAYSLLKNKSLTLKFKVYDILQQNSNISRSVSGTYVRDEETNALGSYCILSVAYQFKKFGNGSDGEMPRGGFGGGRGPRGYERF